MADEKKREYLLKALAKHAARLSVKQTGAERFTADGFGITKFPMSLCQEHFGKGSKVEVRHANKPICKVAAASCEVLLTEFVEHFDCTGLPVDFS